MTANDVELSTKIDSLRLAMPTENLKFSRKSAPKVGF